MTNLAESIQNACEIARQDERRKFKEYLLQLRIRYKSEANCFKKDIMSYNNPIERIRMSSEANGKVNLIDKIINEYFKEK